MVGNEGIKRLWWWGRVFFAFFEFLALKVSLSVLGRTLES